MLYMSILGTAQEKKNQHCRQQVVALIIHILLVWHQDKQLKATPIPNCYIRIKSSRTLERLSNFHQDDLFTVLNL